MFIAAGATVKPSLVFMRRFTDEEEQEYARCKKAAHDEVTELHQPEIYALKTIITNCTSSADALKEDLKEARSRLKQAKKAKEVVISAIKKEIEAIQQKQKKNRDSKKSAEKNLKDLQKQITDETKPVVKKKFDYDVPIAKVDDAGITTTGVASGGNQLPALLEEYRGYRVNNRLWDVVSSVCSYHESGGEYYRIIDDHEVKLNVC